MINIKLIYNKFNGISSNHFIRLQIFDCFIKLKKCYLNEIFTPILFNSVVNFYFEHNSFIIILMIFH